MLAAVMASQVERIVEEIASDPAAHPFGASYVANRAGVSVDDAYKQLEALATKHQLERHFELVSPSTGRSLAWYRLGDTVPIGQEFQPPADTDDETPFVVSPDDILVTFSASESLRQKAQKKTQDPPGRGKPPRLALNRIQSAVEDVERRIRSAVRRRSTSSTMGR